MKTELKSFSMILKPDPSKCQECAVAHPPEFPHDQQSLYYQVKFKLKRKRFPKWRDAMAHCDKEMKAEWKKRLGERGIEV